MGYIKKLKNNELVGGTDKTTIYPVTSAEAVFEEVGDNEFKSQKYLNNHITNERIVDNTIENRKLKDDTIDMGKLNTQLKTTIQNAYDASWKVKEEPFSLETKYDANDVVYDPDTNSSYVSLTADNQGNPVNPEDEGYVEGKWRIIINGISAVESTEVINATVTELNNKFDTLEGNVDEAIDGLDNRIDEIQDDLSSLTAYETAITPSYDAQIPLKNLASTAQVGYYFCTVAGSETVKQVSNAVVSNTAVSQIGAFSLPPSGGHFKVKMSNAHTATSGSVTLRFGSVAATNKPLYYNNEPASASNSWEEGEVISVYYDGSVYQASNAQGGGGSRGVKELKGITGAYITNNGSTLGSVVSTGAEAPFYQYIKYPVNEGDVVMISGHGAAVARLWGIVGDNNAMIDKSASIADGDNLVLIMPEGARFITLNSTIASNPKWYYAREDSAGAEEIFMEAYLYGGLRTLAVGQSYYENEAVKTSDKQLLCMNKGIAAMNLYDEVAVGDLKSYSGNTYLAQKSVSNYDGNESEGLYAIGRPSIITITVDASGLSIEEDTDITVTIGGDAQTITVPAAASETKAADIAALIATAFTSIDGWVLVDNEDGTLTLKCSTGGANTLTISAEVGETGLVISSTAVNGTDTLSQFNNGVWEDVTLADYAADSAEIGVTDATKMWKTLSIAELIKEATGQNSVAKMCEALNKLNDNAHLGNNVSINLSDYTTIQAWPNVNNNNKWLTNKKTSTTSNLIYTGKFIPVTPGQQYKIVAQDSIYAQYALLREEAYSNHADGTTVQYATGTTRTDIPAGKSATITVPANAAYLYVTICMTSNLSPAAVELCNPFIKEYIQDMDEKPTDDSDRLVSSGGVYDAIFDAAIMEDVPYNYTPGYKLNENGTLIADANYGVSDFLECQHGDLITSFHGATDTVASMVVYNSSKTKQTYYRNNTSPARAVEVTTSNAAYFRISFKLDYELAGALVNGVCVFTPTKNAKTAKEKINELQGEIDALPNKTNELINTALIKQNLSTTKDLYLGKLINADQENGVLILDGEYADKRVTNKSMLCVPYLGVKVNYRIPDNIAIVFKTANLPNTSGEQYSSGWFTSATTSYTFPQEARVYRIIFANNNANHTGAINAAKIQELIDNGDIRFTYEDPYPNVLDRNSYKSNLLRAALAIRPGHEPCIFSHISDVHGDVVRLKNFYEYSKYLKVDACLATGDFVSDNYGNRNEYINEVFDGSQLALWVVGNHEFKNIGNADSYAEYTQTLAERYNYLSEAGVVSTHNYYYYDITAKNIRVIALDQYNGIYGSDDRGGKIGQSQWNWFIETLGNTPAGYGVCIILHVPETVTMKDDSHDTFFESSQVSRDGMYEDISHPITHIIDAFINRTTWSVQYTNAQSESISISCDFTNRDTTTEFIGYFCGHGHEDRIGLADIQTSRQVIFSTTIGNALYGPSSNGIWANASDLPRGGRGVCQDCFNIYSIERSTKTVKVIRIGSDITINMTDRKYMEIPYATT